MSNRLINSYRNWRRYRKTFNELSRLSDRDLADIGVNRADIDRFARRSV